MRSNVLYVLAFYTFYARNGEEFLEEIFVDDCFKSRNKLQNIFGSNVRIMLDIFHATQRITKKFSRNHYLKSFKLVFRADSDTGETRKAPTLDPKTLENNIDKFVEQWSSRISGERPILNEPLIKAINNLRVHVRRGCLSNIQPGRGTNRNERLHKHLNNIMNYSKIGVELAYAFLTTTMDGRNEKDRVTQYISDMRIKEMRGEATVGTVPGFGLTGERVSTDCTMEEDTCTNEEIELSDEELLEIYKRGLNTKKTVDAVKSQGSSSILFDDKFVPFMGSATSLFFNTDFNANDGYDIHQQRMQAVTKSWGFVLVDTEGDGNCFFTSMAFGISNILNDENYPVNVINNWQSLGIHASSEIIDIAAVLRQLVVDEWLAH